MSMLDFAVGVIVGFTLTVAVGLGLLCLWGAYASRD